jgi:membrane-bound metal-dependent hydrolase YbcI (DUF457 family)
MYIVKDNKKFPRYYILAVAIGGIIPDLDIGAYYVLSFFDFTFWQVHRTILHTIFIPLIFLIIGSIFYYSGYKNKKFGEKHIRISTIFFILAFGSFIHLVLDFISSWTIMPFYPFSTFATGLNLIRIFPESWKDLIFPTLDGVLLLLWICWMEFKLKISKYF